MYDTIINTHIVKHIRIKKSSKTKLTKKSSKQAGMTQRKMVLLEHSNYLLNVHVLVRLY